MLSSTSSFKDYYQILGVSCQASLKDIKRAFRRLAVKYHPDHNQGDKQAEERFKAVLEAYEVLGNAERRTKYDNLFFQQKEEIYTGPAPSSAATHRKVKPKAKPQGYAVGAHSPAAAAWVKFQEYLKKWGLAGESAIRRERVFCQACSGRGLRWLVVNCSRCNGYGYYYRVTEEGYETCPACRGHGAGEFFFCHHTCAYCLGKGAVRPVIPEERRCPHCRGYGWTLQDSLWRRVVAFPWFSLSVLREECYFCQGSGLAPASWVQESPCPRCQGRGWVGVDILRWRRRCPKCKGSGRR